MYNINYLYKLLLVELYSNVAKIKPNEILMEYDIVFVFDSIYWENLVGVFKNLGISLYGGSSTRRHLLSTVQATLVKFLFLLNNYNLDKLAVYNSFIYVNKKNKKFNNDIHYLKIFKIEDAMMEDENVTSFEYELLLWNIRNLKDHSGKYNYIELKTMN